jgi:hypothetical protein
MVVITVDIDIDIDNSVERDFARWHDGNKGRMKEVMLIGWFAVNHGVEAYCQKYITNLSDRSLQEQIREKDIECERILNTEISKHKQKCLEIEHILESTQQKLNDSNRVNINRIQELETFIENTSRCKEHEIQEKVSATLSERQVNFELQFQKLNSDYELRMQCEIQKSKDEFMLQFMESKIESSKYKSLYEDIRIIRDNEDAVRRAYDDRLDILGKELQNSEQKLLLMQKSNQGRGNIGENTIMFKIRSCFDDWLVEDMSFVSHVCDIHMKNKQDELIAIESKYKKSISPADIEKFYHDIDHLMETKTKCIAAVFVSMSVSNIPHKGCIHLELYKGIPIMFTGFEDISSFESSFKPYMDILVKLSQFQKQTTEICQDVTEILSKIRPLLKVVKQMQSNIEKIRKTHINNMLKNMSSVETGITLMLSTIEKLLVCDLSVDEEVTTTSET